MMKLLLIAMVLSLSSCATMGNFAQGFSQGINSYQTPATVSYIPQQINCTSQTYGSQTYTNCQ